MPRKGAVKQYLSNYFRFVFVCAVMQEELRREAKFSASRGKKFFYPTQI